MKIFTNKKFIQKLIIAIVSVIVLNFCFAPPVQASFGGTLMDLMVSFSTALGDVVGSLIQFGVTGKWNDAVDKKSGKVVEKNTQGEYEEVSGDKKNSYWSDDIDYPVLQVSPELIFANQIEILDANFITNDEKGFAIELENKGPLETLRKIIASWYVTLRTIAVVGLLSVLIYIGIRIIISSTSADKAKYKQRLMDWVIAFCLLFFMHYIMAATLTVVERINNVLASMSSVNEGLTINPEFGEVQYTPTTSVDTTNPDATDMIVNHSEPLLNGEAIELSEETDIRAIQEAKSKTSEEIINEPGSWEHRGLAQNAGGSMNDIYYYDIEYKSKIVHVAREELHSNNILAKKRAKYHYLEEPRAPKQETSSSDGKAVVKTNSGYTIYVSNDPSKVLYFVNYARLFLNYKGTDENMPMAIAYLIIYIALITFTAVFAIRYIKRVIYVAFLTLMAPMVALTYPLDKIKDRKSTSLEYVV